MTPPGFFSRGGVARRRNVPADQDRPGRPGPAGSSSSEPERAASESRETRASVPASRAAVVTEATAKWRAALVDLGGSSTLTDMNLLGEATIDLTAAHPSGIAQLYAGRTTRLSNLVREGSAQLAARRGARTVRARADELAQRYGLAPTYLAIGVATWTALPELGERAHDDAHMDIEASTDPGTAHPDRSGSAATPGSAPGSTPGATPSRDAAAPSGVPAASRDHPAGEALARVSAETPASTHPRVSAETPEPAQPDDPAETPGLSASDVSAETPVPPTGPSPDDAPPAPVRTVRAPVLLRSLRLTAHAGPESDFDLDLEAAIEVNPVLARALREAGVRVDLATLARSCFTEHGFTAREALATLATLGREHLAGFELGEQIVVGSFVHPGQVLVEDLDALAPHLAASDVVAALAGDAGARATLDSPLPERVATDRAPEVERGAGDLDVDQQHAVDVVASGRHVFLDAPPGSDVPGTLAAVVADAAASGRSVLYVPGTRRTGKALRSRLDELGLDELTLDLSTEARWRTAAAERLRTGLSPAPVTVDDATLATVRAELTDVHHRLRDYVAGLHAAHDPWRVSAYDALQALARLTSARPGPRTRVRLGVDVLDRLDAAGRDTVRERLSRAAALGAFTLRPVDTPWYGADLTTAPAASEALERTQRLGELGLPALMDQAEQVATQTGLVPATTLAGWREQLDMLDGVAEALDVFVPQIFERSAADMVVATATRAWRREQGVSMRGRVRRRLRKQARDLQRPGRPVADVHAELVRVQEQREIWRRYNPGGGWPRLPNGLAEIRAAERAVRADVEALQAVIGSGVGKEDLFDLPLGDLTERLKELGLDAPALRLLPERTALLAELRGAGLGALVDDLTERRVPGPLVESEFDLAWWSSVLEQILRTDPALAGYDGPALTALAERFRELDAAHVAGLAGPVRRAVAEHVVTAVRDHRDAAGRLFTALDGGGPGLRETVAAYPELVPIVRPVWLVAPMLVPQLLPESPTVDLLVLDGVQHLPVEQAVAVLARARQVVLVGDSRRGGEGLVPALAPLLPSVTLPTGRAERDEGIAAFLAEHGYGGVIRSVPAPPSPSRMRLDLVDGVGMPDPGTGAIESVQAEVDRVCEVVTAHASAAPEESLAVVALNARHADRVREAVRSAVAGRPELADFFRPDRVDPFTVVEVDAAAGLRRDVVVLSVGYGKTPHGRVLHRFGALDGPDGLACVVDALDAVRHQLVIVSCIGPGEIDSARLRRPGPQLLAALIDQAAVGTPSGETPTGAPMESPDQLLVDLAERVWRLGLTVVPRYGLEGGVRIPLGIGHPDLPEELVVAVLTDDEEYVAEPSLRRRDRHWVQRLTARGWRVHMAFSTAVFMDPQAEAEAIRAEVMEVVRERQVASAAADAVATTAVATTDPAGTVADVGAGTGGTGLTTGDRDDAGAAGRESAGGADADGASSGVGSAGGARGDAESGDERADTEPVPVRARGPRPPAVTGLPLAAYSDDQLDDLLAWIVSDGADRSDDQLVEALRTELALTRRGAQVDAVLGHVVRRRAR
ncbi:DNA helicase [Georgenia sp.]